MLRWRVFAALVLTASTSAAGAREVSLESLLREMIDRRAPAAWPDPSYECVQFSSYDRRSVSSADPRDEGWFANADAGNYLRHDERDGRREGVMVDAEGPGAIVRIWSANPKGTLRVYLDGSDEPAIEMPMAEALGTDALAPAPFAAVLSRGYNLLLPIPFAERCVVTTDDPASMYYQVNVRRYEPGTAVRTFTPAGLDAARETIDAVAAALESPDVERPAHEALAVVDWNLTLQPGETFERSVGDLARSAAIDRLSVRLDHAEDAARRACVLEIDFDGETTVSCPLGDFFATAPGLNAYESWPITVEPDGTMISRWVMPFRREAVVRLRNEGASPVAAKVRARAAPHEWTDRSMHFHAGWTQHVDVPTRPRRDMNFLTVEGRGVLVGDALTVGNPVEAWWGEGDEKIFVDGEAFPSHFGTGTEDYYGYAWCSPEVFTAPLHNQTRCDGPGNYGFTSVNRFRALDAIPFERSLDFDMELWHWRECETDYETTVFYYARPGATDNLEPVSRDAARTLPSVPALPPPFTIEGAIESEDLASFVASPGVLVGPQTLWRKNTFSGDAHLWIRAAKPGDFVEIQIPVPAEQRGRRRVLVKLTKSWDYGVVRCFVDGEEAGGPIDTFNADAREVDTTGLIDLGEHDLGETFTLRLEIVGTNADSEPPHHYAGLDCVVLEGG